MRNGNRMDNKVLWLALYAFGIGGVVSVLVDLDHILAYYGFIYTQGMWEHRPLHIPLAIIACGVGVCSCAYLGRLAHKVVLRK